LQKVQIPQALPTIMAGVNQTTMMALAMVVIASLVGAKGIGMEVLIAINQVDINHGFEAGLSIVILAIIIDRLSQGVANRYNYKKE
jgi:glycine betaine/proline transport system permease protein